MSDQFYKVVKESELFREIPPSQVHSLISCLFSRSFTYKKNEYIVIENEKFENVGFIISGEVSIVKESFSGIRTILASFKAGDIFGEVIAFSGTDFWPSSVLAQSDCEIMFIPRKKILGFCDEICDAHKHLVGNLTRIISKKVLILNEKVEYLTIKSMKAKLSRYLLEQYKRAGSLTFTLPLNRESLAEFLNVSRPSMSRELCRMRDDGLIEFFRETVKIKDVKKLEEYVHSC